MRRKSSAKREAICATAGLVFAELGYERTSMAEISTRVGGSKATLYSYFPSKEVLFIEATTSLAERLFRPALDELKPGADIGRVLRRFGMRSMSVLTSPEFGATERLAISASARSGVGRMFYEAGPALGIAAVTSFLARAMAAGQLRRTNARHAAEHLLALLDAESHSTRHFVLPAASVPDLRGAVNRAVDVFLAAYRPDAPAHHA